MLLWEPDYFDPTKKEPPKDSDKTELSKESSAVVEQEKETAGSEKAAEGGKDKLERNSSTSSLRGLKELKSFVEKIN